MSLEAITAVAKPVATILMSAGSFNNKVSEVLHLLQATTSPIPHSSLSSPALALSLDTTSLEAITAVAKPVATILASAESFGNAVSEIAAKRPEEPTKGLADTKDRWLVCTVKNMTDFPILSLTNHVDSGRYDDPPQSIDPFQTMTFMCCERDSSPMQGVSGGHSFCISLDDSNHFFFALGFTNPRIGGYKASVVQPADDEIAKLEQEDKEGHEAQKKLAEKAYNESDESGNVIKSRWYKAKDADKKEVVFQFQISASAGRKPVYTITAVRNYLSVVS